MQRRFGTCFGCEARQGGPRVQCAVVVASDSQSVIDHSRRFGRSVTSKHVELRGLRLQRMPPMSLGFGERRGVTLHPSEEKKNKKQEKKTDRKRRKRRDEEGGWGSKPKPPNLFRVWDKKILPFPKLNPSSIFHFLHFLFLSCLLDCFFPVRGLRREVTSAFSPTLSLLLSSLPPSLPRPRK